MLRFNPVHGYLIEQDPDCVGGALWVIPGATHDAIFVNTLADQICVVNTVYNTDF